MTDDQLLISELAERAGVSVRTIRFYINEGLLPPPEGRGRYSAYDEEYLTRIELIKRLKSAFLPLKEIKRMVESLSKEEIEHMLRHLSEATSTPLPAPADTPTAAGTGASPKRAASPDSAGVIPPEEQGVIKESGLPEALNYITRVLQSQGAPASRPAPAAPPAAPLMPGHPLSRAMTTFSQLDEDTDLYEETFQAEESESSWRRYIIQPGVALLVSESVYTQSAPSIHSIVAQVKQLFSSHPSGGKNV
jgi:DNA-binding transcriptional MerR regulator